jgi:predicted FMN-binding regulatory protein PaiB
MYIPVFNRVDDRKKINAFIHAHGFATIITQNDERRGVICPLDRELMITAPCAVTWPGRIRNGGTSRQEGKFSAFSRDRTLTFRRAGT